MIRLDSTETNKIESMIQKMYAIEYSEIQKFKKQVPNSLYFYPASNGRGSLRIESIRKNGDLFNIRYSRTYSNCGGSDTEYHSMRIPVAYFSMNNSEIENAHTQWTKERIEKIYLDHFPEKRGEFLANRLGIQ